MEWHPKVLRGDIPFGINYVAMGSFWKSCTWLKLCRFPKVPLSGVPRPSQQLFISILSFKGHCLFCTAPLCLEWVDVRFTCYCYPTLCEWMKTKLCAFKSLLNSWLYSSRGFGKNTHPHRRFSCGGLWVAVTANMVFPWASLFYVSHPQWDIVSTSVMWAVIFVFLSCLRSALTKEDEHVEHWHTSKKSCRQLGLASKALWGRWWRFEGFLQEKLLEMVLIERSMEGVRAKPSVVQKAEETCLFASDVVNADSPWTLLELHLAFTSRDGRVVRKVKNGRSKSKDLNEERWKDIERKT